MKSLKLAEKRHSVREFKNKLLSEEDKHHLNQFMAELSNDNEIEYRYFDDGFNLAPLLKEHAGYIGKMIEAPYYYAILCTPDSKNYKAIGYQGETFVLHAIQNNIGFCWLEVRNSDEVKRILGIHSTMEVAALLAIGYGIKESQKSIIYSAVNTGSLSTLTDLGYPNINAFTQRSPVSVRKSIQEFVYLNQWGLVPEVRDLEDLGVHEALFYMRLAPSYKNIQPWTFVFRKDHIDLVIEKNNQISETLQGIDAGIAMLYFEVGLHESGIPGQWDFSDFNDAEDIPDSHTIVARYSY